MLPGLLGIVQTKRECGKTSSSFGDTLRSFHCTFDFCAFLGFHETPVGLPPKDQTEQAQSKDLRDHAKCHSNCRSPSSAHGMPQWNFRTIGPIATDFC